METEIAGFNEAGEPAVTRGSKVRKVLLICGILSGAFYFAGDVLLLAAYPGYSYLNQTVSELNAIGAPTRGLSIAFGIVGYLFLVSFGAGVWQSAAGSRRLRMVGAALAELGVTGMWGVPFASMQPRGTEQPAAHAISGMIGVLLLVLAMGFAASALGRRFRLYSIATIVAMLAFASWSAMDAGAIEQGLATPWIGIKERISFYSWHLWFIVLALTLLTRHSTTRHEVQ